MRSSSTLDTSDQAPAVAPPLDVLEAARAEGLRYVTDREPGIRRVKSGSGFKYLDPDGRVIRDKARLKRIRSLAIPPAYKDVWICVSPQGHLQATGKDARGRKQYRYHAKWREHRDTAKFGRMLEFGRALPRVRRRVSQHLRLQGLPKEKVLAAIVRLLECTLVRVGNEEYARSNGSYGLTTLRDRHVHIKGETLRFEFKGKSGIVHRVAISDPALARIVQRCQDIPGQELFQWIDADGERRGVDSNDVNEYLREASGSDFTAKDFRTWFATIEALRLLASRPHIPLKEAQRYVKETIAAVSQRLGNTPTICRKCYIHPAVLSGFLEGALAKLDGKNPLGHLKRLLKEPPVKGRASVKSYSTIGSRKQNGGRRPTSSYKRSNDHIVRSDRA
jgi:DNA topoisomerase-1